MNTFFAAKTLAGSGARGTSFRDFAANAISGVIVGMAVRRTRRMHVVNMFFRIRNRLIRKPLIVALAEGRWMPRR
jgi:hypothetical protein